jgi:N-acetylglucosaminyldiphosphoundecaprenol N-acetyl-beta-D-mannosaminyltransferase
MSAEPDVGRGGVFESVQVGELRLARATSADVVETVFERLHAGQGGTLVTPNLDILQLCAESSQTAALFNGASLVVADGMPVLWLARLAGRPLPGRVAGSDLVWLLAERAAREGRSLFLLGGDEGVAPEAKRVLERRFPGLRVAGCAAPRVSFPPTPQELAGVRAALAAAAPDLVFCAFGSPKQERLAAELAPHFPLTWFLGCGAALSFIAGHRRRAPRAVQRLGLEWVHRLLAEPGRLARRYLLRNLPYLLANAAPRALRERFAGPRP